LHKNFDTAQKRFLHRKNDNKKTSTLQEQQANKKQNTEHTQNTHSTKNRTKTLQQKKTIPLFPKPKKQKNKKTYK
jgi:hypothetical protein